MTAEKVTGSIQYCVDKCLAINKESKNSETLDSYLFHIRDLIRIEVLLKLRNDPRLMNLINTNL